MIKTIEHLQIQLTNTFQEINTSKNKIKVNEALKSYNGIDWKQYIKYNTDTYNRELIYSSPEYDLVIVTWCKDQGCAIHNHPKNGCSVKILQNSITEELYETETLNLINTSVYNTNDIMYIDDSLGYHRMCNKNNEPCISLHVYAPGKYKPKFFKKSD